MKRLVALCYILALLQQAQGQSDLFSAKEMFLIEKQTDQDAKRVKYFVFIDKNDCFNCTLSASLIAKSIDSNQVFVLTAQIPKHQQNDYAKTYKLSTSFHFVQNKDLMQAFQKKAYNLFQEKSFIAEVSGPIVTFLPLKKFKDKSSFGKKPSSKTERQIFYKGEFISSMHKFAPFLGGYVVLGGPKNEIFFFVDDSLQGKIHLDSQILKTAFDYVTAQQTDSIRKWNNYQKCMTAYDKELKKMGLPLVTAQNFITIKDECYAILQVNFPIWTSNKDITFMGEVFFIRGQVKSDKFLKVEKIIPIDNEDLPLGKSIFAYNYWSYRPQDKTLFLGYSMDSNYMNNSLTNHRRCKYKIKNDVFVPSPNACAHHPEEVVKAHQELKNIALIHQKINEEWDHYTYLPLLIKGKRSVHLPLGDLQKSHYRHYASKSTKTGFLDICTINGIAYMVDFELSNGNCLKKSIIRLHTGGLLQAVFPIPSGFEYIIMREGIFFNKSIGVVL